MSGRTSDSWFATRLRFEWSEHLDAVAKAAGIRVFRTYPAASTYWRPEWGTGDAIAGHANDPAEVVLELTAQSPAHASAIVVAALGVEVDEFVVWPECCPAAARG